ncbi:MAG TPA: DUF5668 domain-containing protein [Terriglobales bacterium]|jgi:hypothetical protein|nr:DUF5668 domain-containing protein [Terriglobales bacterium]
MNCANHADAPAVAYCRTCGKALCANCTRPVRGVIYCEDCLGAKMEGAPAASAATGGYAGTSAGSAGFVAPGFSPGATRTTPPMPPPAGSGSAPNPTVAGILAGFFPFGVGAVYTGQYAKGLAHLLVITMLIAGASASEHRNGEALGVICGFGIAFFYVYQIIDAVRSAKAIQMAQPIPDPFGLASTFGGGTKIETGKIPTGAIVLILLGVLFLLHTMGLTEFGLDRFWPVILIFIGGWMFARNWGMLGEQGGRTRVVTSSGVAITVCQCARCRTRRIMGPAVVFTIGVLFLLDKLDVGNLGFHRTWPLILLVVGAVKLMQGNASTEGHVSLLSSNQPGSGGLIPPTPPTPPPPPAPPTEEVNRG